MSDTRLFRSLHRPADGKVCVGSDDICYISDQVYFSDTTIYDYVSEGNYEEAEVSAILDELGMTKSINNLEEGIHTRIVNHSIPLSGGEIVRLKMARALIQRQGLILMGEPTSALDASTEQLVRDAHAP